MRYAEYDDRIYTIDDLEKYKRYFENDIQNKQKELKEFIGRANKRIDTVKQWEAEKQYKILGSLSKTGRRKDILFIVRYKDGTQREERYSFDKVSEARTKLKELTVKYDGVDWSDFREEI